MTCCSTSTVFNAPLDHIFCNDRVKISVPEVVNLINELQGNPAILGEQGEDTEVSGYGTGKKDKGLVINEKEVF